MSREPADERAMRLRMPKNGRKSNCCCCSDLHQWCFIDDCICECHWDKRDRYWTLSPAEQKTVEHTSNPARFGAPA